MTDDQLNDDKVVTQTYIQHQTLVLATGILQVQETCHHYKILRNNEY